MIKPMHFLMAERSRWWSTSHYARLKHALTESEVPMVGSSFNRQPQAYVFSQLAIQ